MNRRRPVRMRTAGLCLGGALMALVAGDRARMAPPPGVGIDPFEVLDLQVRNNVLIILDTSGSMKWPTNLNNYTVGSDDPSSRMYQAKQAIKAVVAANSTRVNFGLATYNVLNTQKTLARTQDFEDNDRADGPFVYVSADAAAAPFYTVRSNVSDGVSPACTNVDGFFCQVSDVFTQYNSATASAEIWRSFSNRSGADQALAYDDPYPVGCTVGAGQLTPVDPSLGAAMRCRYYMQSRLIRNNVRYTWNMAQTDLNLRLTAQAAIPGGCPAPPPGLVGHAGTPPCFQFQDSATGAVSTFYYSSAIYQQLSGDACGGGALISQVAPCDSDNSAVVTAKMDFELPLADIPVAPGGPTFDYADGHLDGDNTVDRGLRADQSTPLAGSLNFVRTAGTPAFPPQATAAQKNFVILVTDGDDTCADSNTSRAAVLAAEAAEQLYLNTGDFRHQAETLVVAFAAGLTPANVNVIGKGGSGGIIDGNSFDPATAVTGCQPGTPCRNAFFAQNTQQLVDVLNQALERAATSGFFSATPSVFDGVPEFVKTVPSPHPSPGLDPMNPETRYQAQAFRSYRSSFEAGNFNGFVQAFDSAGPVVGWEAGQKLLNRISPDLVTTDHSFRDLLGPFGPGASPPGSLAAAGHIQRRIFSTSQNGRNLSAARVNLWPPDAAVAPNSFSTAGTLDDRLFRKADGTQMTITDLQAAPLKACVGANLPPECASTTASVKLAAAKREAREMILGFTAGAEARRDTSGNPIRFSAGQIGQIAYRRRSWVLAESTVGSPALVTPPINTPPTTFTQEYLLYRDGPRDPSGRAPDDDAFLLQGYGLRHPDRDGKEVPVGALSRPLNKPEMSVVYVPSNDMLHAFRAGPCPIGPTFSSTGALPCSAGAGAAETGGEELWAFVPHDLLPALKDKMKPQTRTDHTFMISTSLRFGDVFVPGNTTVNFNGQSYSLTGRWRRVLMFGRGIGGKSYTTLDITGVGSFSRAVLETQLPTVLWNRGNPDTQNGLASGTRNGTNAELTAYANMGQTWSTPAIGRTAANGFVAFVGSGYGTVDTEGTRFYTLNVLNGDVIASADVGDGGQPAFQNALVANPVVYSDELLVGSVDLPHPSSPLTDAAYVGDIHGRLWKFDALTPGTPLLFRDLGIAQPIGAPAALLNMLKPFVFVQTGNDVRVNPPPGGFKAFGFEDNGVPYPVGTVTPPLSPPEFSIDLPVAVPGKGPYRGTLQPVTAFRGSTVAGEGVVFFTATRFNPITAGNCVSSFDTIIFGLVASTGGLAYPTQQYEGVKAVGVPRPPVPPGPGDPPPVDQGTAAPPQQPEQAPVPPPKVGQAAIVSAQTVRPGSAVCR
jgi:hypothetical protein